jgi:glycosyltransferase involved in cell wall biosynthesis
LKKIIISVTNDLVSDQRVHRTALTLHEAGFDVVLVGRILPNSLILPEGPYRMHRMKVPFRKGFLFYTTYNIWLFFFLLIRKSDALLSNDLDTLPANFIISKIKSIPLIFDSHELFTEVPELVHRPFIKKIWTRIEMMLLPRIKFGFTVCNSIAEIYRKNYNVNFEVVRNLPCKSIPGPSVEKTFDDKKKIIIYQGSLNIGRGIELVIEAMKYLDNFLFIIAGEGDISKQLHELAKHPGLEGKIHFLGKIPFSDLFKYTVQADLGISLEENLGMNYFYALPNKLFDYIQAQVPVLTSDFPEMGAIVRKYNIGFTTNERDAGKLAKIIEKTFEDKKKINTWKENLKTARLELCWENEKEKLINILKKTGLAQDHLSRQI